MHNSETHFTNKLNFSIKRYKIYYTNLPDGTAHEGTAINCCRVDYKSKHALWGSRTTISKSRELSKVIQEKNYSFLSTGTPTYWPTDGTKSRIY